MSNQKSKHRYFWMLGMGAPLLCLPLIAMQFTEEVDWSVFDFFIMGILIFLMVTVIELTLKKLNSSSIRFGIVGIILLVFFLIWAELAVGIFNSSIAGS